MNGFFCDCPTPYTGDLCDLLPCDFRPCGTGGNCVSNLNDPDGFTCQCLPGFTGKIHKNLKMLKIYFHMCNSVTNNPNNSYDIWDLV